MNTMDTGTSYGPELNDTSTTDTLIGEYANEGGGHAHRPYKEQKYIALYKARVILAAHGTPAERLQSAKQLKIMKKKGLEAV